MSQRDRPKAGRGGQRRDRGRGSQGQRQLRDKAGTGVRDKTGIGVVRGRDKLQELKTKNLLKTKFSSYCTA